MQQLFNTTALLDVANKHFDEWSTRKAEWLQDIIHRLINDPEFTRKAKFVLKGILDPKNYHRIRGIQMWANMVSQHPTAYTEMLSVLVDYWQELALLPAGERSLEIRSKIQKSEPPFFRLKSPFYIYVYPEELEVTQNIGMRGCQILWEIIGRSPANMATRESSRFELGHFEAALIYLLNLGGVETIEGHPALDSFNDSAPLIQAMLRNILVAIYLMYLINESRNDLLRECIWQLVKTENLEALEDIPDSELFIAVKNILQENINLTESKFIKELNLEISGTVNLGWDKVFAIMKSTFEGELTKRILCNLANNLQLNIET